MVIETRLLSRVSATSEVTALARGLDILACFDRPRVTLSVSEIARRVGLTQQTTWRLCQTLISRGFLVRNAESALLRPGAPVLTLGYSALAGIDPQTLATPHMQQIADSYSLGISLGVCRRNMVISVARAGMGYGLDTEPVGWRAPLASVASGLAILAAMPIDERAAALVELKADDQTAWPRRSQRIERACAQWESERHVFLDNMLDGRYTAIAVALRHNDEHDGHSWWALSTGAPTIAWDDQRRNHSIAALHELLSILQPAFAAT